MRIWYNGVLVDEDKLAVSETTLVIGEAPSANGSADDVPLRGGIYRTRLMREHGLECWVDQLFHVANAISEPQPRDKNGGSSFDLGAALRELDLERVARQYTRVVCLGARVWTALSVIAKESAIDCTLPEQPRWLDVAELGNDTCCALRFPHPSGLNRWWNDPIDRERAYEVYRAFVGLSRRDSSARR